MQYKINFDTSSRGMQAAQKVCTYRGAPASRSLPPCFGGAHLEALPGSFKYPWNLEFHRRDAKRNKSTNPSISAWHKRWSAHMSTFPAQFVNRSFDSICPDGRGVSLCEPPLTGRFASRAWFRSVTYRLSGTRARNVCMGKSAVLHMLTPNRRGKISV